MMEIAEGGGGRGRWTVVGSAEGESCSLHHYGTMDRKSICVSVDIELYHTNRLM